MTDAAEYAAWYEGTRGAWIGSTEFALLLELIDLGRNESLLDVGCGTGYFTSYFARCTAARVVGMDPNSSWLHYAQGHAPGRLAWVTGRAEDLPFPDASFDMAISVTALCFIADQERAFQEIIRVTRRRFALGLLNRHSLLWWNKGRCGGTDGYQGAHWHTVNEVRELVARHPVRNLRIRTGIFLPGGGRSARWVETFLPRRLPFGAFLAVAGDVAPAPRVSRAENS